MTLPHLHPVAQLDPGEMEVLPRGTDHDGGVAHHLDAVHRMRQLKLGVAPAGPGLDMECGSVALRTAPPCPDTIEQMLAHKAIDERVALGCGQRPIPPAGRPV